MATGPAWALVPHGAPPEPYHEHTCRACDAGIPCHQTDEECDRNGGIGQYNGQCDDCNRK